MGIPRWLVDTEVTRPAGVPDDAIVRVLRVPPEGAGVRLDVFLSGALRNTSRTRAKLIAEHSAFSPSGRRRKASERVRAEDHIVLWRRPVDDVDPDLELPVLYSDEHLLVLDKPANLTVHPTARHHHATVTKILQQRYPGQRLQLIHRLDKETSGVLLLAKTREAERAFKMKFEGIVPPVRPPRMTRDERRQPRTLLGAALRQPAPQGTRPPAGLPNTMTAPRQRFVDKEYYAICWGAVDAGLIDLPIEADPHNPLRVKMRVAEPGQGLDARTDIEVLARCPGYSLVRCFLFTGRQHQIRVHLSARGCPVVGDKLYGPDDRLLARGADGELTEEDLRRLELSRHALHAWRYRLQHAITSEPLELRSPLPADLVAFWQSVSGFQPPTA
jgi:23S rRNA pseudouridine1911/1915/1917 synthase